jgi:predicted ferric reductase
MTTLDSHSEQGTAAYPFVEPNPRTALNPKRWLILNRSQDFVEGIGWLSIVWVVFTFLIDGGANQVTDLHAALGVIDRLTALIATDLLLIQLLLIARVPWLDKLYGHDRATLTHKKLGKPVLYMIIAHFLAVVWGYAISEGKNLVDEYLTLVNVIPDLITASIAFVLMVMVVVTSIKIARKRLSYEAWYLVHLFGYGSVMFAIPHQISTGIDIAGKPLALTFWISAYLFVGLNILWFRLLSPIVFSAGHKLQIGKVVRESSDSVSIYVNGKNLKNFNAQSGQFFILRLVTPSQWWRAHPFSISAAPTDNQIRFTIGNRGDDTELLQHTKPGTRVILEGPYGVFTEERRTRDHVILIAAGIGAPPIRALAESVAAKPGDVTIIYRVRDKKDAPLVDELNAIAKKRGFYIHILEGNRRHPKSWLPKTANDSFADDRVLQSLAPKVSKADVYICGPAAFTHAVTNSLIKAGTPVNQIHAEEFAW